MQSLLLTPCTLATPAGTITVESDPTGSSTGDPNPTARPPEQHRLLPQTGRGSAATDRPAP
ncbi:hypothetical protein [Methanosphaerula subterraneus]|uniref:hypothetical protein n=1 Tax=Methanosphaerula subterraneus TaxID=3350244 RepID=UPI003F865219